MVRVYSFNVREDSFRENAKVVGDEIRLDGDSFFSLLVATGAVLPDLMLLYRSDEDDFRVYAGVEGGNMRFFFAVKHKDVWKIAEGLSIAAGEVSDHVWFIELWHTERDVLEAIRDAVEKVLIRLRRFNQAEGPIEYKDEKGNVVAYYLLLYDYHITPFLEYAAKCVKAEPVEVWVEGERILVRAGRAEGAMTFRQDIELDTLFAKDIEQIFTLYKSLRAMGLPVKITPMGVKVDVESMWILVAMAVEKAIERGVLGGLPAEVMPGVELLNVYNVGSVKMYVFWVSNEGIYYYLFTVKTGDKWRVVEESTTTNR